MTGARALVRNDFASSVFTERSLLDLGLDGGLGGLSIVRDISSADDAKTLVLDEPALILPLFSQNGDSEVRLFRRLDPGLVCLSSSSSSLLDEFEVFDSVPLELEVPSSFSLFADGDSIEQLLDFSGLEEPLDEPLPVAVVAVVVVLLDTLEGILNLDLLDFTELEDPDGTA